MQTFLPFGADFEKDAAALDMRRLGKQRVEAKQILETNLAVKALLPDQHHMPWKHHPAVKMWEDDLHHLAVYGLIMCTEWVSRGYKDNLTEWFLEKVGSLPYKTHDPDWLLDWRLSFSHCCNLIRKDRIYHSNLGEPWWSCKFTQWEDIPYFWPPDLAGDWDGIMKHLMSGLRHHDQKALIAVQPELEEYDPLYFLRWKPAPPPLRPSSIQQQITQQQAAIAKQQAAYRKAMAAKASPPRWTYMNPQGSMGKKMLEAWKKEKFNLNMPQGNRQFP